MNDGRNYLAPIPEALKMDEKRPGKRGLDIGAGKELPKFKRATSLTHRCFRQWYLVRPSWEM